MLGDVSTHVTETAVTSGLQSAIVWVEVQMPHGLFDAHTQHHVVPGARVDGVNKYGIIGRQPIISSCTLKHRPSGVQS